MRPVKVKLDVPYIRRCPDQTDKYNLNIFIGTNEYNLVFDDFKTDEYNLNKFMDTNE
jgi:hypothetical protein